MKVEILTIFFLKLLNIDFILNSDGGFVTKGFFKTVLKKILIQSATYYLSSGSNTSKTLQYYGAKSTAIYEYHFSSLFEDEVLDTVMTKQDYNSLRVQLNLNPDTLYLIFVGQLIYRKGVDVLLESLKFLRESKLEVLIIGSGEDESILKEIITNQKTAFKVHFLGKLSKELVLKYMKISDLFVFPSREDIWGLVLNEAIANGLPIVTTINVGSGYSLINSGKNGLMIEVNNSILLGQAINELISGDIKLMKSCSLQIAKEYTIENMAQDHMNLFRKIEMYN